MSVNVTAVPFPRSSCPGSPPYAPDGYGAIRASCTGGGGEGHVYLNGALIGGTSSSGYAVKGIPPGTYRISARQNGCYPEDVDVEVAPFRITDVAFILKTVPGFDVSVVNQITDPNSPGFFPTYEAFLPYYEDMPDRSSTTGEWTFPLGGSGLSVYVDDKFYSNCECPCDWTFKGLSPGIHTMRVIAGAYESEFPVIIGAGTTTRDAGCLPVVGISRDSNGTYHYDPIMQPYFVFSSSNPCSDPTGQFATDSVKATLYYGACSVPPTYRSASGSYTSSASGLSGTWSVAGPPSNVVNAYKNFLTRQCNKFKTVAAPVTTITPPSGTKPYYLNDQQALLETSFCPAGQQRCYGQELQECSGGISARKIRAYEPLCDHENWWSNPDDPKYPRNVWFDPANPPYIYNTGYGPSGSATPEASTSWFSGGSSPSGEASNLIPTTNPTTGRDTATTVPAVPITTQYTTTPPSVPAQIQYVTREDPAVTAALQQATANQSALQQQIQQLNSTISQLQSSASTGNTSANQQLISAQASMSQLQQQIQQQNAMIQQLQAQQAAATTQTEVGGFSAMLDETATKLGVTSTQLLVGGVVAVIALVLLTRRK